MELGLSLGDKSCETFHEISGNYRDGFTKTSAATPTMPSIAGCSGFCMALTINPSSGSYHELADDGSNEENDQTSAKDHEDLRENQKIKAIIDGRQKVLKLSPPLQLDLLPPTLVDSHASLPCSSDIGSSHGGSSGNVQATKGFQVNITPSPVASTEEATSFLRLDFCSYSRTVNVYSKKALELRNDAVDMERASPVATDEDDNGIYRKKLRLTKQQSANLEESFKDHSILNPTQKLGLAKQLKLSPRQVEVWFQNRRARTKLKQTEVDYEYLKKCCETLTGENRRLHKELQELRSLKTTSNSFNLQHPATTLTMCPSCERVAQSTVNNASVTPITNFQQPTSTTPRTGFPLGSESRSLYPFFGAPSSDLA